MACIRTPLCPLRCSAAKGRGILCSVPTLPKAAVLLPPDASREVGVIARRKCRLTFLDVTGYPAITVPAGLSAGLPVGMMLIDGIGRMVPCCARRCVPKRYAGLTNSGGGPGISSEFREVVVATRKKAKGQLSARKSVAGGYAQKVATTVRKPRRSEKSQRRRRSCLEYHLRKLVEREGCG